MKNALKVNGESLKENAKNADHRLNGTSLQRRVFIFSASDKYSLRVQIANIGELADRKESRP